MRKGMVVAATVIVTALAVVAGVSGKAPVTTGYVAKGKVPIKLAFSTWNGYMALVIASKEGYYKKHGLNVTYTVIEDPVQRFNAFKAGSLNAIATTVDTYSRTFVATLWLVAVATSLTLAVAFPFANWLARYVSRSWRRRLLTWRRTSGRRPCRPGRTAVSRGTPSRRW